MTVFGKARTINNEIKNCFIFLLIYLSYYLTILSNKILISLFLNCSTKFKLLEYQIVDLLGQYLIKMLSKNIFLSF
ncbi:hypothetical protein EU95_0151 [Prochlorococcus marinus str. MIT 9201]|uniref:Uncharacterized protein n=1 Tax=Prochlorococcus marinus str. MIT 9201 TaxID=93057 RepID=A0A0A2AAY3_PROMR|nr:hypothetical protein EU95_0151 [Prochlorococcus marinus str. MIT 9201]